MDGLIRTALESLRSKLDESFVEMPQPVVTLSRFVDAQGAPEAEADDKVVMFLTNIERETTVSTYAPTRASGEGAYGALAPPLYINLSVLVAANQRDYVQGLAAISQVIQFFQVHPVFTAQNTPELPSSIEKLAVEMQNLDTRQTRDLCDIAGIRYLPMVVYKIRMLNFVSDRTDGDLPDGQSAS